MQNQHFLSFWLSAAATLLTFAYGPDRGMLTALLVLMAADYGTGILAATLDKGLCSKVGYKGLAKKFAVLIVIAVTHHMDLLLGTSVVMLGGLYFYSALELISITENCGRLGVPMPAAVRNAIKILKEKGGDDNVESPVSGSKVSSDSTE